MSKHTTEDLDRFGFPKEPTPCFLCSHLIQVGYAINYPPGHYSHHYCQMKTMGRGLIDNVPALREKNRKATAGIGGDKNGTNE